MFIITLNLLMEAKDTMRCFGISIKVHRVKKKKISVAK